MGIRKRKCQLEPEPPLDSNSAQLPVDAAPPAMDSKKNVATAAGAAGTSCATDAVAASREEAQNSDLAAVAAAGAPCQELALVPARTPRRARSELSDLLDAKDSPGSASEPLLTSCVGCFRYLGVDSDYNNLERAVQACSPRFRWCTDCKNLHRTKYEADICSLSAMKEWMERENNNQAQWDLHRIAAATLRWQNAKSIRESDLDARCDMLRFAFRLACLPTAAFQIVPLSELRAEEIQHISAQNLVMLRQSAGLVQLGAWVPLQQEERSAQHGLYIPRRCLNNGLLALHPHLRSDRSEDAADLERLGIEAQASGEVGSKLSAEAEEDSERVSSKFEQKMLSLQKKAEDMSLRFCKPHWPDHSESDFQALAKKVAAALVEANWNANDEIGCLKGWQELLMGGKKLLSLYKRWNKSNKSTSKLHEVFGQFAHEFTQRFKDVSGKTCAPSIRLLVFRVDLLSAGSGLAVALQAACDRGLKEVLQQQDGMNAELEKTPQHIIKVGPWLDFVLKSALQGLLSETLATPEVGDRPTPVGAAGEKTGLCADLIGIADILHRDFAATPWDNALNYFGAWRSVCQSVASPSLVDSRSLEKAVEHLEAGGSDIAKDLLVAARAHTGLGPVLAAAEGRLLRYSSDLQSTSKVRRSRKYLKATSMPKLWRRGDSWFITRCLPLVDSSQTEALQEVLWVVAEAVEAYSEVGLRDADRELGLWQRDFAWTLKVMNLSLSAEFLRLMSSESWCSFWYQKRSADAAEPTAESAALQVSDQDQGQYEICSDEAFQNMLKSFSETLQKGPFGTTTHAVELTQHTFPDAVRLSSLRGQAHRLLTWIRSNAGILSKSSQELIEEISCSNDPDSCGIQTLLTVHKTWSAFEQSVNALPEITMEELETNLDNIVVSANSECPGGTEATAQAFEADAASSTKQPTTEAGEGADDEDLAPTNLQEDAKSEGKSNTPRSLKEFLVALQTAPWRGQVRQQLLDCSGGLLKSHFESLELDGLSRAEAAHSPTDAVVEAKPTSATQVQNALQATLSSQRMLTTASAAKKFYSGKKYEEDASWMPAEKKYDVLESVWKFLQSDAECWKNPGTHYWNTTSENGAVPWCALQPWARAMTQANFVAGSLLYLQSDCLTAGAKLLDADSGQIKAPAMAALSLLDEQVSELKTNLPEAVRALGDHVVDLKFSVADAMAWVGAVQNVSTLMKEWIIQCYKENIVQLCDALATRPNLESCCNDQRFNKTLAQRNILGWSGRKTFNQSVLRLQKALRHLQQQYKQWAVQPPLEDNATLQKTLQDAGDVWDSSFGIVQVMAACSTALETDPEQRAAAAKAELERNGAALPQALKRALESARDAVAPSKRARTTAAPALEDRQGECD